MGKIDENIKYCHVDIGNGKSFFFDHVHIVWNEQITFHQSNEWEISYIITGSGTRIIGDKMETFSKGEIIILPPNLPHGWYFDEHVHDNNGKIENVTIIFPNSLLEKFAETFPETKPSVIRLNEIKKGVSLKGDKLPVVQELMRAMIFQNNMERLSTLIFIFSQIASSDEMDVVGFREKRHRGILKMQDVYRFMLTNYHQKISLDNVANVVGMNRSSFCSFFKRENGKSFFAALNEYRINCACLMLKETEMPIADICFAVGFNDIPYFNRSFKKQIGSSPKDYRTQLKT